MDAQPGGNECGERTSHCATHKGNGQGHIGVDTRGDQGCGKCCTQGQRAINGQVGEIKDAKCQVDAQGDKAKAAFEAFMGAKYVENLAYEMAAEHAEAYAESRGDDDYE